MLMVDVVHDFAQTYVADLGDADVSAINDIYSRLVQLGHEALERDGFEEGDRRFLGSAETRYQGQEHTLNLPLRGLQLAADDIMKIASDFNEAHEAQYGHRMDDPAEIVTLRLRAVGLLPRPELPRIARGNGNALKAMKGSRSVYQPGTGERVGYAIYDRGSMLCSDRIVGPAIVQEPSSTTVIHADDGLTVGQYGELVIDVGTA